MVFVLVALAAILLAALALHIAPFEKYEASSLDFIAVVGTILTVIYLIALIVFFAGNWARALDLEAQYQVFKTGSYHESVIMIEEHGQLILKVPRKEALTDFAEAKQIEAYYQAIQQLREDVIRYNTLLAERYAYRESIVSNWLIAAPDTSLKYISLAEY